MKVKIAAEVKNFDASLTWKEAICVRPTFMLSMR
jgi:hypothetical protein